MTGRDDAHAETFERLLRDEASEDARMVERLYGDLPHWFPPSAVHQIHQALDCMRKARQEPRRLLAIVARARRSQYTVPATATDPADFIKSLSYLAHVQWLLEHEDKSKAIAELAGSYAAKDHKRSKAGNEEQAKARAAKLPADHPLKSARNIQERNRLIRRYADQLHSAHPNLRASDIKERTSKWAAMSPKQVGRILR